MTFSHLGLSQKTLDAIDAAGFKTPTPIQEQTIPSANEGRDVVGIAQTGTGKTASFVLPMLTKLENGRARTRMPRSLILEPTRELAAQVTQSFEQLGVNHKLNIALLIGGVSFDEQYRKLDRGADVLIATPGRLLDHYQRGKLLMSGVEILVIDEADRMLDMGFIPDIEKICGLLPVVRQTLFFSATMPKEVKKLADKFLKDPIRIEVSRPSSAATTIIQRLKLAPSDIKLKREVLRDLINGSEVKNAIIFCNRKRDVSILHKSLVKHGYNAGALHGDMEQRERTLTLDAFRRGEIVLLAASDVAARGLDIPDVSHIFNFDVPVTPEDYVHRIGRTGRAGKEGYAATLVTPRELEAVRAIENLCREKIEWLGGEPSQQDLEDNRGTETRRLRPQRRGSRSETAHRGGTGDRRRRSEASGAQPADRRRNNEAAEAQPVDRRRGNEAAEARPADKPRSSETVAAQPADTASQPRGDSRKPRSNNKAQGQRRQSEPSQNERKPAERSHTPRGSRQKESEVLGMGDHVPAFLMTPVRRSK